MNDFTQISLLNNILLLAVILLVLLHYLLDLLAVQVVDASSATPWDNVVNDILYDLIVFHYKKLLSHIIIASRLRKIM